ncbi:hypothetical protein ACFOLF_27140 [Paenibacillus sepulcri]
MNKKKKWLSFGIPLTAGAVLLVASGFTASAGSAGYDAYKEALKTNTNVKSVTADVSVTVSDNGAEKLNAKAKLKLDKDQGGASGSLTLGGAGTEPIAVNMYHQNEQMIVKNGKDDMYYVIDPQGAPEHEQRRFGNHEPGWDGFPKELENVIDTLVGNVKQQVDLDEQADGVKHISLDLTGSQIPAAVNAIGSLLIKHAGSGAQGEHNNAAGPADSIHQQLLGGEWQPQLPELAQDVRIEAVSLDALIGKDNRIQHQTVQIKAAGKDEAGADHTVTVTLDAGLSAYNSTSPEVIDLDNKQVVTVDPAEEWGGQQ